MKKVSIILMFVITVCLAVTLTACVKPETKVTAKQWQDAFEGYAYFGSVTVKMTYTERDKTEITTIGLDALNHKCYVSEQKESTYETYYSLENDAVYNYSLNDDNKWEKCREEKLLNEILSSYTVEYTPYLDDFKDRFDAFSYDEETKRYAVTDRYELDKIQIGLYDKVVCAFSDGKVTYFQISFRNGGTLTLELYDYNKTRVKLPKL